MRVDLRASLLAEVRAEVEEEREGIRHDLEDAVWSELRDEMREDVRSSLKIELRGEVRYSLERDLEGHVWEELRASPEMKDQVREAMLKEQELRGEANTPGGRRNRFNMYHLSKHLYNKEAIDSSATLPQQVGAARGRAASPASPHRSNRRVSWEQIQ